jgi:hypothetical protein
MSPSSAVGNRAAGSRPERAGALIKCTLSRREGHRHGRNTPAAGGAAAEACAATVDARKDAIGRERPMMVLECNRLPAQYCGHARWNRLLRAPVRHADALSGGVACGPMVARSAFMLPHLARI